MPRVLIWLCVLVQAGAFFAAQGGLASWPPQWAHQVNNFDQLQEWTQELTSQRSIIDLIR